MIAINNFCIVFPVDKQVCKLYFIESEYADRVELSRRNSTYVFYMFRNEQWQVTYVGHDPKPLYLFIQSYKRKGRWEVTIENTSNPSFTVKLELVRYPQFYVRLNFILEF